MCIDLRELHQETELDPLTVLTKPALLIVLVELASQEIELVLQELSEELALELFYNTFRTVLSSVRFNVSHWYREDNKPIEYVRYRILHTCNVTGYVGFISYSGAHNLGISTLQVLRLHLFPSVFILDCILFCCLHCGSPLFLVGRITDF